VDYVFNYTSNVAVLLCIVEGSKLRRSLIKASVGRCSRRSASILPSTGVVQYGRTEDGSTTLPLIADHATHLGLLYIIVNYCSSSIIRVNTYQGSSKSLAIQVVDAEIRTLWDSLHQILAPR